MWHCRTGCLNCLCQNKQRTSSAAENRHRQESDISGHQRQRVGFGSIRRTCIMGFATDYNSANIWLSEELALCSPQDMTDGLPAPAQVMAKRQLALREPEFTLTLNSEQALLARDKRGTKEGPQHYPLPQSVCLAAQSRVRRQNTSRNGSTSAMGSLGRIPRPGIWRRSTRRRFCLLPNSCQVRKTLLRLTFLVRWFLRSHSFALRQSQRPALDSWKGEKSAVSLGLSYFSKNGRLSELLDRVKYVHQLYKLMAVFKGTAAAPCIVTAL